MAIEITVPRLGWSMEEGIFREWLVEAGAMVKPGQALFLLESDKAAQEVECFESGILALPLGTPKSGETVRVGQLLGFLLAEGERVPENRPADSTPVATAALDPRPDRIVSPSSEPGLPRRDRVPVTPRARRRARELGVDLASICGSGRGGRIRERDVVPSTPPVPLDHSGSVRTMTARALASAFDALVGEVAKHRAGYGRADLLTRLILSSLRQYPVLNGGDPIEIGRSFGLTDFTGRRIERWTPEIPPEGIAALGVGRAVGNPSEYPLNLSYDPAKVPVEEAAGFLDFLCEVIESPLLGLVR